MRFRMRFLPVSCKKWFANTITFKLFSKFHITKRCFQYIIFCKLIYWYVCGNNFPSFLFCCVLPPVRVIWASTAVRRTCSHKPLTLTLPLPCLKCCPLPPTSSPANKTKNSYLYSLTLPLRFLCGSPALTPKAGHKDVNSLTVTVDS